MPDLFLGTWDLLPELCLYDAGTPPEQATYRIIRRASGVQVGMTWRLPGSTTSSTGFAAPCDGTRQAVSDQPGVTGLSVLRVDERTLDTTAWNGSTVISTARRVTSADGELLVVLQSFPQPAAGVVRTYQVYRRRAAAP